MAKVANDGLLAEVSEVVVIGGSGSDPVRPCGCCRQILNEAAQIGGRDIIVHCSSGDGTAIERHLLSALLPHAFGPKDLI